MSIKNIWTLNIDEALVADELKNRFNKVGYEIFFPLNGQLKDIDLLLTRLDKYKSVPIQVKGSRTYSPSASEIEKFGNGSAAWFKLSESSIIDPANKVSAYVFVLHSFGDSEFKKVINIDFLVIPSSDLVKIAGKKKMRKGDSYHFFIWVDSKDKRAFDFNNPGNKIIPLSKYLNNWKLLGI